MHTHKKVTLIVPFTTQKQIIFYLYAISYLRIQQRSLAEPEIKAVYY